MQVDKKTRKTRKMEIGGKIYCKDESVYSDHITKRKEYIINDFKDGQIRIKNNQQKLVWIPENCFSFIQIPEILTINIDDKIDNSMNDCLEVTIEFSNGKKIWTTFITSEYLDELLKSNKYLILPNFIIVKQVNEIEINKIIRELDSQNKLTEVSESI